MIDFYARRNQKVFNFLYNQGIIDNSSIEKALKIGGDLKEYFKKWFRVNKKYMLDFMILDMILTDFDTYRLKTYEDYKIFLFSLPIYNKKYKSNHIYLMQYSIYAYVIKYLIVGKN